MIITLTANGSTEEWSAHDGDCRLQVAGEFGGGTLVFQLKINGNWQDAEDGAWTSGPITKRILIPHRAAVRLTLSGATGPAISGVISR